MYKPSSGSNYGPIDPELFFGLRKISKHNRSMGFFRKNKKRHREFVQALMKLSKEDWTGIPTSCEYKKLSKQIGEGTHKFKITHQHSVLVFPEQVDGRLYMHLLAADDFHSD